MFFITFFDLHYNLVTEYLTTRKVGKGGGTGEGLFETLKKILVENKLILHFLVSLTTDGASACRGRTDSAVKYMVAIVNTLITVHCFCHQFVFILLFFQNIFSRLHLVGSASLPKIIKKKSGVRGDKHDRQQEKEEESMRKRGW